MKLNKRSLWLWFLNVNGNLSYAIATDSIVYDFEGQTELIDYDCWIL